jgi:cytochrome P450
MIAKKLGLLDRVWQETLGKHLAVATWSSQLVSEGPIEVGDGFKLPVRALVTMSPYALHQNPHYWPNLEAFVPSRFDPVEEATCRYIT